jgi:hypothetical protein
MFWTVDIYKNMTACPFLLSESQRKASRFVHAAIRFVHANIRSVWDVLRVAICQVSWHRRRPP